MRWVDLRSSRWDIGRQNEYPGQASRCRSARVLNDSVKPSWKRHKLQASIGIAFMFSLRGLVISRNASLIFDDVARAVHIAVVPSRSVAVQDDHVAVATSPSVVGRQSPYVQRGHATGRGNATSCDNDSAAEG